MRLLTITACLVLTGCATSGTDESVSPAAASAPSAAPHAADAAPTAGTEQTTGTAQMTAQLEVDAFRREEEAVVCKREAPVGSRIPITRCYPRTWSLDEHDRQELDEFRRQRQLLLEQQRMGRPGF